jgi:hypothetical protein
VPTGLKFPVQHNIRLHAELAPTSAPPPAPRDCARTQGSHRLPLAESAPGTASPAAVAAASPGWCVRVRQLRSERAVPGQQRLLWYVEQRSPAPPYSPPDNWHQPVLQSRRYLARRRGTAHITWHPRTIVRVAYGREASCAVALPTSTQSRVSIQETRAHRQVPAPHAQSVSSLIGRCTESLLDLAAACYCA